MTYAAVPALRTDPQARGAWLPRLASPHLRLRPARPGGQARAAWPAWRMTEKQGGSDLRANTTVARRRAGRPAGGRRTYRLTGHKWFCSAPMSDALPRPRADARRARLLRSCPASSTTARATPCACNGSRTSSATAPTPRREVELDGTWGVRVGDEGRGIRDHPRHGRGHPARLRPRLGRRRCGTPWSGPCTTPGTGAAFGAPLVDQPLMQNVLADLALEAEAAHDPRRCGSPRARRRPGDTACSAAGRRRRRSTGSASAPPAMVAEALECLGGNGYVEENGLARLYREAPLNSHLGGLGQRQRPRRAARDVAAASPDGGPAGEIDRGRGADHRLDRAMDEVAGFLQAASREARRDPAAVEAGARCMVERLAVVAAGLAAASGYAPARGGVRVPSHPGQRRRRSALRHPAGRRPQHAGDRGPGPAGEAAETKPPPRTTAPRPEPRDPQDRTMKAHRSPLSGRHGDLARHAVPARRDLRRRRHQLRAVLRGRRARRAVPVRRRRRRAAGRPAGGRRLRLARLPAAGRPGPALRLPGARPVRPGERVSAATRPSCCSTPTPRRSRARSTGTSRCSPTGSTTANARNDADSRGAHDASRSSSTRSSTGATTAARARRTTRR